jgi:peptidoglycan hydrolase-like protein with peptidoglycan-binding domain
MAVLFAAAPAAQAGSILGERPLSTGVHGSDVATLQRFLRQVGIPVKVDGAYETATAGAVKRFQLAANLPQTGATDPKTILVLRRACRGGVASRGGGFVADGTSAPTSSRSLGDRIPVRGGMAGHDVKILQAFLSKAGFVVRPDGSYGSGTARAVKRFERTESRPVNGIMDAGDIAQLRDVVHQAVAQPPAQTMSADATTTPETPLAPAPGPGQTATVGPDGLAVAPADAPQVVKDIVTAGNRIASKPYKYGGGHGNWDDTGYDCSGSVSYALHGANLLDTSLDSTGFESWGRSGPGQWVTIYANSGHAYMVVAGLRFDTSGAKQAGTRWQAETRSSSGYVVRHPEGL